MVIENIPLARSLLIVGPPDTGKASVLRSLPIFQDTLYIDLDDPLLVRELLNKPEFLKDILYEVQSGEWLTINRIDRILKYLPDLFSAIENKKIFIAATTGSELTDQKHFNLIYTSGLSYLKIKDTTDISTALQYGMLPKNFNLHNNVDKARYLKSFVENYITDELIEKSKIRNLVAFHLFLPLAVENVGTKLNYTRLSQQINVDYKTIQNFYDLLAETHTGFYLKSCELKLRKVQTSSSRFYFFDSGFMRALENKLTDKFSEGSSEYRKYYKQWCISEIHKMNRVLDLGLKLSYIETKDKVEIDLVIETPNQQTYLISFEGAQKVIPAHLKNLNSMGRNLPNADLVIVSEAQNELIDPRIRNATAAQFFLEVSKLR
jgi:predicted AAA+ superfamily ATPase